MNYACPVQGHDKPRQTQFERQTPLVHRHRRSLQVLQGLSPTLLREEETQLG